MTDYTPTDGDHVRLVVEGRVSIPRPDGSYYVVGDKGWNVAVIYGESDVSVEKIDPPYTDPEFVPGMVVRNAADPEDYRRWSHEDGRRFLWINRPDAGYAIIRNRHQLPNRLAVAYDPRQDAP